jgi:hypothetical protein
MRKAVCSAQMQFFPEHFRCTVIAGVNSEPAGGCEASIAFMYFFILMGVGFVLRTLLC